MTIKRHGDTSGSHTSHSVFGTLTDGNDYFILNIAHIIQGLKGLKKQKKINHSLLPKRFCGQLFDHNTC